MEGLPWDDTKTFYVRPYSIVTHSQGILAYVNREGQKGGTQTQQQPPPRDKLVIKTSSPSTPSYPIGNPGVFHLGMSVFAQYVIIMVTTIGPRPQTLHQVKYKTFVCVCVCLERATPWLPTTTIKRATSVSYSRRSRGFSISTVLPPSSPTHILPYFPAQLDSHIKPQTCGKRKNLLYNKSERTRV